MAQPENRTREEELYTLSYMQQLYQNQYNAIVSEINRAVQYLNELAALRKTLDDSNMLNGKDVLVSLGAGAYMSSTAGRLGFVLVDIGAGHVVEKDIDSAKAFVDDRVQKSTKTFNNLVKNRNELRDAIIDVARRIDTLNHR
ncbi:MAG: prefoldin subunit alpha [Candidatus Marsarchaeota archaeon]|jgi:prefoldin alpha subunit|nr:prefoldin subunit alpha [Candidatus Marsarchaeota archaeon]MCL5111381.1 prefoldin subunit alpha [Candidatus Marsarchaeota archaeon]